MNPVKLLIFSFILTLSADHVVAQYPFSKILNIEEENLTLKSNVLMKDHFGFLWIGTSEGLFKYNSAAPENITSYTKSQAHITSLHEDTNGAIWAGCKNGQILIVKNNLVTYFNPPEGHPKVTVTAIYQDAKGRMWFATAGEGLYYFNNNHLYNINVKDGLSDDYVNCLYSIDGIEIIAGTDRGLSLINPGSEKINILTFTTKNGLPDNLVRCVISSGYKDAVWIGMQSKGIALFSTVKKQLIEDSSKNNWRYGQVNDLIENQDAIYIATEEDGIVEYDKLKNNFKSKVLKDTLFPSRVSSLQTDNEGNIWAASENKLVSFTGNYLKYWYKVQGTNLIKVHSILAADDGNLWFTPDLRLFKGLQLDFGKDNLRSYDITPPKDHIDITGLYKDRFGYLWIGTMGEGLFRMNIETGKWRRISENPVAYFGNILSICGKDDQVWISTLNGVSRFNLNADNYDLNAKIQFRNFNKRDGLGSDYIYHILIDRKNRVWFATDGAGVAVFDNGVFTNFYSNGQFYPSVAYSLAEDKNGHIWISSYNEGLFEYNGTNFIQYGIKEGLSDLAITSIAVDDLNNIIAINKKGIDIIVAKKNIVQHYSTETGFTELQPNLNSISKGQNNNIWIGTDNGIVILNTNSLPAYFLPVAVIEKVSLFNTAIDTALRKNFSYDENNFSFKLAAAYYRASEKIKFQYWLEGYSKNWETTADRVIIFPQLHPGKYLLKIRASANENFTAAPVTYYSFNISKSFWTTWWFYLLSGAFISLFVYWFVRQRIKSVRETDRSEMEKFQLQYDALKNQVNPHFLFNSFNTLMNIVEDDPNEAAKLIKHLSQFYRKMTAFSKEELISLSDELELLNSYLFIQKKRFGDALQVLIDIDPILKNTATLPPLVLQLLTENAVKHNTVSKDKPLQIHIYAEKDFIVMRNNINKKLDKEESEGVGLQNIKNRYKMLINREVEKQETEAEFIIKLPLVFTR